MRVRVEHLLQPLVEREHRRAATAGTRPPICRRRGTASRDRRAPAPTRAALRPPTRRRTTSQRSAPPHSINCVAGQVGARRRRAYRQPPQRRVAARRRTRTVERLVAQRAPERRRRRTSSPPMIGARRSTTAAGAPDRRTDSRPSMQARRRQRQRPAAPFVHASQRLASRRIRGRASFRPSGAAGTSAKSRSARPACRARRSSAATRRSRRRSSSPGRRTRAASPVPSIDAHAEHEVAHRAGCGRRGPDKPAGDDAAERRAGAVVRRLEREHLAVLGAAPPRFRRAACRARAVTTSSPGSYDDDAGDCAHVERRRRRARSP